MVASGLGGLLGVSAIMFVGACAASALPAVVRLSHPRHLQLVRMHVSEDVETSTCMDGLLQTCCIAACHALMSVYRTVSIVLTITGI